MVESACLRNASTVTSTSKASSSLHYLQRVMSEENRRRSDSDHAPSPSSSSRDEEEEATWERSLEQSLIVLSDASVRIMQEDWETNLERMRDTLISVTEKAKEAQQLGSQPVPQLHQLKLQLHNYLITCKKFAGACKDFGDYLSSPRFIDGLKKAVQEENIQDISKYLDNVTDSLQTCNQYSAQIELDFSKIRPVLRKATDSANESSLARWKRTNHGMIRAGVSSTVVTAAVVVTGFLVDPIFTGPIALGVMGGGLVIVGVVTLPFSAKFVRGRRKESQILKNVMEALENLDISTQTTNEIIGNLRGSVDQHTTHLRKLQMAKQDREALQSEPTKDYIYRNIDSLQAAMKRMAQKAAVISRMELPPQLLRPRLNTSATPRDDAQRS